MLVFIINWVFIISTNANRAATTVNKHMSCHKYSHTFGGSNCYLEQGIWPCSDGHSRRNKRLQMWGHLPLPPLERAEGDKDGSKRLGGCSVGNNKGPDGGVLHVQGPQMPRSMRWATRHRDQPTPFRFVSIAIEFTFLKHIIRWLVVQSPSCATNTSVYFQNIFATQRETLLSLSSHSLPMLPSSPSPALGIHLSAPWPYRLAYGGHFLSMESSTVWSSVSAFIHWASWLQGSSMREQVAEPNYSSELSNIPCGSTTFCLSIYQLVDIWVDFTLWPLGIALQWVSIHTHFASLPFPILLGLFPGGHLWGPREFCVQLFEELLNYFRTIWHFNRLWTRVPLSLHAHPHLSHSIVIIIPARSRVRSALLVVLYFLQN